MKRSLFLILASLLTFGTLVGCEDDDEEPTDTTDVTDSIDDTAETAETADTTETEEDGEVTPVVDACSTSANQSALESYAASAEECEAPGSIASAAFQEDCGFSNADGCVTQAVQDATGIDNACANCYASLIDCTVSNCLSACTGEEGAGSEACATCRAENNCDSDFSECSGISASCSPCPGADEACFPEE